MPRMPCQRDGRPGFKWGATGKCYTYKRGDKRSRERAIRRVARQQRAIRASQTRARGAGR